MSLLSPSSSPEISTKILIFAGVPPPVHGQNLMVAALIAGLKKQSSFCVVHIDPRLSSRTEEVGRGGLGKIFRLLRACARAWAARFREGPMIFYYVPAPGKRVPVLRDWIVLFLCRPFFSSIVLHWHAVGLGDWLRRSANPVERILTRRALDSVDLAIVLAPELAADAEQFHPKAVAVVPNGIADPVPPDLLRVPSAEGRCEVLFLGLGCEAKGLFVTLDALRIANARGGPTRFYLTFAGEFGNFTDENRFREAMEAANGTVRHAGLVSSLAKASLFQNSDVFCLPSQYPHEGQPLVLIEALAFELPIVTTRWRGISGMLPDNNVQFVDARSPENVADGIERAYLSRDSRAECRKHYLANFTLERHLCAMREKLTSLRFSRRPKNAVKEFTISDYPLNYRAEIKAEVPASMGQQSIEE